VRRAVRPAAAAALLLGLSALAPPAWAHSRSVSWSSVEIEGQGARIVLRVPQLELTRLPWGAVSGALPPGLAAYAISSLRLEAGGRPCPVVEGPRLLRSPTERAALEWRVACPTAADLVLESDFLLDVAPSHLHFARVRRDGAVVERVLSDEARRWPLLATADGGAPAGSTLGGYVWLGVEHIAGGADHLAFLLALLLLARRAADVLTIVTGFTVAHSITLALAALGRVAPASAAVEALIGLSIALVAAENAWLLAGRPRRVPVALVAGLAFMAILAAVGVGAVPALTLAGVALFCGCYFALLERVERPLRMRFAVAFAFGLVHGFGFAGVLAAVALPQGRLLTALLGFNLGVEAGQIAVVAAVWPLLRWLSDLRAGAWHRSVVEAGTAAVCGLGVFWLVSRAYA